MQFAAAAWRLLRAVAVKAAKALLLTIFFAYFALAMLWGIAVGTYSSVFIAAPILDYLGIKRDWVTGTSGPKLRARTEA